ncbi:hypothetical protein ACOACQ_04420 [Nocardioides sp. CPCC 206347]|uniref:hypothetical protein n=1 Tax=Nocardioides sp. CPCC 206347 TaxID=3406463 RepID=UPI003B43A619
MTDETQLRSLLRAAVPDDASSLDPQVVSTAARRARHRHRLVGLGAAAATIAVIGAVAVVATQGPDDDRAADSTGTTAPYDAPACPATLPELNDANMQVDDLRGLTSVRLCPDPDAAGQPGSLSRELVRAREAVLGGMDALVGDFAEFADQLENIEPFDPGRCAAIDFVATRQSLQFSYADGSTVLVPTAPCSPISFDDHAVDGGFLADAYLAALGEQRDRLDYTRPYEGPLSCDQWTAPSPARPGREHLIAAVLCSPQTDAAPTSKVADLSADQLADLDAAWQNPGEVAEDLNEFGENNCTELQDAPLTLVAATDHGDVIRLTQSPCGFLNWNSWELGEGKAIPTTLEDLGLD